MAPDCNHKAPRPQFLKVLFSLFLDQMLIPPKFMQRHLAHEAGQRATLVSPLGKFWHVDLCGCGGGDGDAYFAGGWADFARANALEEGSFLVFRYEGNMVFTVKIFDAFGCLKEYGGSAVPPADELPTPANGSNAGGRSQLYDPLHNGDKHPSEHQRRSTGEIRCATGMDPSRKRGRGRPRKSLRGKSNQQSRAKRCRLTIEQILSEMDDPSSSAGKTGATLPAAPSLVPPLSRPRRVWNSIPVEEDDDDDEDQYTTSEQQNHRNTCRDTAAAKATRSDSTGGGPVYAKAVSRCNVGYAFMNIGKRFCTENGLSSNCPMTLMDPEGRPWPVKLTITADQARLTGGWAHFSRHHGIKVGDKCIFQVVDQHTLHVSVIRA